MGLLSGSISVTRFNVVSAPPDPDFASLEFREIPPTSEQRKSIGVVPFEPQAEIRTGTARWAFRLRIDTVKPDPTAVAERLKGLLAAEQQVNGLPFVGAKKRQELKNLAEEELLPHTSPVSRIIECCLDDKILYVGSVAKAHLGVVEEQLRKIGVQLELKTPWIDRGEANFESDVVPTWEPGASILGCRFLRAMLGDAEVLFEPENGSVMARTREAKVSLSGGVLPEVHRLVEQEAELLAAKLLLGEFRFRLDALTWRLSSLSVPAEPKDHWTQILASRVARIAELFERLDDRFEELASRLLAAAPPVREW